MARPRPGASHEPTPRDLALYLAVVCATAVALTVGRALLRRARGRARMRRALRAEDDAGHLLRRAGYEILGRQVRTDFAVRVDGAPLVVELRADYVVERGGARFVAEVKSGRFAPRIETAATRRQLLEYRVAFDVDGVLLVDGESEEVREVAFDAPLTPTSAPRGLAWFIAGLAMGAIVTLLIVGAGMRSSR